ncbi:hypothetical protein ATCC27039_12710 [Actinomyces naeslundii]|nr:translation initiation factor IF-2 [Actinomyces naeslundii]BDH77145.1 hypothetical protein ATCC27039_12710 [Actinomyces naeslundii]
MAKPRVHELAKELDPTGKKVTSKVILAWLKDQGEFVKAASSAVEPPVARRVREHFAAQVQEAPADTQADQPAKAASPAPKPGKAAPKPGAAAKPKPAAGATDATAGSAAPRTGAGAPKPGAPAAGPKPAASAPKPGGSAPAGAGAAKPGTQGGASTPDDAPKASRPGAGAPRPAAASGAPTPGPRRNAPTPGPRPGAPRPGNNPFATSQGMPRQGGQGGRGGQRSGQSRSGAPRPGNNPFATSQGMPRPGGSGGPRPQGGPRPGGPRPQGGARPQGAGRSGAPRPGGPRPNPGMMPGQSSIGRPGAPARGGAGGGGRGSRSGGGGRPGGGGGRPGGGFGGPRGGRGGRGSTQGAFGRGGGAPRGRKSKRAKRQEFEQQSAPSIGGVIVPRGDGSTPVRVRQGATLTDLAEKINANPAALVTVLFHLGEMATATQSLDEDTFALLGAELGYNVQIVSPEDEDRELLESFDIDLEPDEDDANLVPRPPVVTVMGHVDHGKTKLLDAIRSTDVVAGEAGGITQSIGAYQVRVNLNDEDRSITFIDTPGHEAFTAMRARGAEVTDIAILVVAADDGVMPQTVEALNHAQAANVPIVVAVNKIDKEGANPDKIRGQLTEYGLVPEEYGGETMFVDISAKQRLHIDELLEAVLLTADAALDLRANPETEARGVTIEAKLDKGRGAVSTILVERGTLRVGDPIVAGSAYGRVRAMFNEHGENLTEAGPARPALVLGLTNVPSAGDSFIVAPDDRTARQIADKREAAERAALLAKRRKRVSLENLSDVLKEGKVDTLNLILKGDSSGAVEALEDSLLKIDVGEEVALRVIHRGVGAITQNDVNLATVDSAVIIGFNVRPAERVSEIADREGVDMKFYSVIYNAIEDVEAAMKGMLKPVYEEVGLGTAEIRQIFRSSKFGSIAGSIVRSGIIKRGTKARLVRDGVVINGDLSIETLRREKDDVTEVREGYECGINLGFKDIAEGDVIETWEMREKPRD